MAESGSNLDEALRTSGLVPIAAGKAEVSDFRVPKSGERMLVDRRSNSDKREMR
jgi:hypothetical protein